MMKTLASAVIGFALLGGSAAWSDDAADQAALIKALSGAKHSLAQGIAQVAKGTEVPDRSQIRNGRWQAHADRLHVGQRLRHTRGGQFLQRVRRRSYRCNVGAEERGLHRSRTYRAFGAVPHTSVDDQGDRAGDHSESSPQGTVVSVKEKVRNGKAVFEVMTVQGNALKTTYYDLMTGEPAAG